MNDPKLLAAMNRLCKWRTLLAGWQLGTRAKGDPECDAVRDSRELLLLLRVEVNALTQVLMEAGVIRKEAFSTELIEQAGHLERALEKRFPGCRASDDGMEIDVAVAAETMKGWRP